MARSVTLEDLRCDVGDRADVHVSASGTRHTYDKIHRRINRAIQRWRLLCATAGDDTYMKVATVTTSSSSTPDAAGWAPRQYIAQPSDFAWLRGMDIFEGSEPIEMLTLEELERNDFDRGLSWGISDGLGIPVAYMLGGTNAAGSSLIQIFPKADGVYTIRLRYLPVHTDITEPTDTVDFIFGGEEWVINDAALQTLRSDGLAGSAEAQACAAENTKLERELSFAVSARRGGAQRRIDTRGRRRALLAFARSGLRLA